jgi:hypothetical protein
MGTVRCVAAERTAVPDAIVERLRTICLALPGVVEETAWTGVRWSVRRTNMAHVVMIADGWPPAYADAAGHPGPLAVLTFRATPEDHAAAGHLGAPFFVPPWGLRWKPQVVGVALDDDTDWDDVRAWIEDSHRLLSG